MAAGDPISAGCQALNDPSYDVMDSLESLTQNFFAGEMFTIAAGPPETGPPTSIVLQFNSVNVDSDGYPGTLTYTVPADGEAEVKWFRNGAIGEVTWTVACMRAATR